MVEHESKEFGIIGLGRIGGGLALQALEKEFRVVGSDKAQSKELVEAGLEFIEDVRNFHDRLSPPRVILLYVPAGQPVDDVLTEIASILQPGDVVVDGGNSYWGDSIRRHERLRQDHGIHFVDCGTSGGARGARHGACFMAGGTAQAFAIIEPILATLAVEGGYTHCGGPGSGHFVKLVHNGIEFGMLQAIGEGVHLLEQYRDQLPIADILHTWTNGSVIRSWLVELMEEEYRDKGGLKSVEPHVEDTGEVNWLVDDAMKMGVPVPVIAQSVMQLLASRDNEKSWARAVAMIRHGFGEHPFGSDPQVHSYRRTSRLGPYLFEDIERGH